MGAASPTADVTIHLYSCLYFYILFKFALSQLREKSVIVYSPCMSSDLVYPIYLSLRDHCVTASVEAYH